MQVGAGKAEVLLKEEIFPLEHFEGMLERLYARTVLIRSNRDLAFVSLELTSLQDYAIAEIRKVVAETCELSEDAIFVSVTHTFSAPHTRSKTSLEKAESDVQNKNHLFLDSLYQAVGEASRLAYSRLEEAELYVGQGHATINVNRDIETTAGYWLGQNEAGFSSPRLPLLIFKGMSGKKIAILYSYDIQSSLIAQYKKEIVSSDVVGKTSQLLESCDQKVVALYLLGCAADQVPKTQMANLDERDCLANLLKEAICNTPLKRSSLESLSVSNLNIQVPGQVLPDMKKLQPTRVYSYLVDGYRQVEVLIINLGDVALVLLKPELSSLTGQAIVNQSPYSVTMVSTMINGGQKYMAHESAYNLITYEAMNSMFAQGAAEIVCQAIVQELQKSKVASLYLADERSKEC